ncbi:MAG: hypothetical protein QM604_04495 [Microbacterium sp.]
MGHVLEYFDAFPFDTPPRRLKRDELALLSPAEPKVPGVSWDPIPPLQVAHFDQQYIDGAFVPPRILWEGVSGRIEWQQMNFRQPMYHRNLDVDEMSFQIRGGRTLMTELGTVELDAGDFVRIPVGVAHDNYGRRASHILWYFPAPMTDVAPAARESVVLIPPFEGWTADTVNEVHTDCLGGRHCDTAVQLSDENLILEQAYDEPARLKVIAPSPDAGTTQWVWRSQEHAIGLTTVADSDGRTYLRHRNADEVQYQVSGTRLLISANGVVEMTPGTFVHIPVGVAYASIAGSEAVHVTTVTTSKLDCVWDGATESTKWSLEQIEAYRDSVVNAPVGA